VTAYVHVWPVRIYYEDTDHGGVVYYANYLRFMERARTEFLRCEGIELDELERNEGVLFSVTQANIRYLKPARFNDMLEVRSRLLAARGARLAFSQCIFCEREAIVEAEIRLACTDRTGRPSRIPPTVSDCIKAKISRETQHEQ